MSIYSLQIAARSMTAIVLMSFVISCASQAPKQEARKGSNQGVENPYQQANGTSNLRLCNGVVPSMTQNDVQPAASMPINILDGNNAFLTDQNDANVSLCSAFTTKSKKAAIFQFAGVLCLTCRDEAPLIQQHLASSPVGTQVAHFIVFTDLKSQRTPAQVNDFIQKYANSNATPLFDENQKLWKQFAGSDIPDFGTTIVINNAGQSIAVPNGREISKLLPNVEPLVRAAK